jgi:hypothetical protein
MSSYGFRNGKIVSKKEINLGKRPVQYTVVGAVAYSTGALVTGWNTKTSTAAKTNTTLLKQPPYPMPLVICPNVAGTAGGVDKMKIKGYDSRGIYREELVTVAATAAQVAYSNYAYSKITSLKPSPSIPTPKSTDIGVGFRPKAIGLPYKIDSATDLLTVTYGSTHATTAATVDAYNKLTLATTASGKVVNVMYLSKLQK